MSSTLATPQPIKHCYHSYKFLWRISLIFHILLLSKMKHCCVEDPADLCSVNIANKELVDVKEEDLGLFENVAYVNAGENYLPFGEHKYDSDKVYSQSILQESGPVHRNTSNIKAIYSYLFFQRFFPKLSLKFSGFPRLRPITFTNERIYAK